MTGAELAVAMSEAGLSPSDFARLYGVPQARVLGWIDGVREIPHSAAVMVRLLQDEHTLALADKITADATR